MTRTPLGRRERRRRALQRARADLRRCGPPGRHTWRTRAGVWTHIAAGVRYRVWSLFDAALGSLEPGA